MDLPDLPTWPTPQSNAFFREFLIMVGAGKLRSCPPLASAETLFRFLGETKLHIWHVFIFLIQHHENVCSLCLICNSFISHWMYPSSLPCEVIFIYSGSPSNGNLDPPPAMMSLHQFQRSTSPFSHCLPFPHPSSPRLDSEAKYAEIGRLLPLVSGVAADFSLSQQTIGGN